MAEEQKTLPQGKMPEPSKPTSGTDTVCVACKVGPGITFGLYEMIDDWEPVMGGGQKAIKKASALGISYTFRGPAQDIQLMRRGTPGENPLAGGFALTSGIPREHWEKIAHDYRDHPAIANGLVFATKNELDAMTEARTRGSLTTGLEGIDPDNPGKRTGVRAVTRAERPGAAAV